MNKKELFSARNLSYTAVLLALVIVLQAVGGTVSIGAVQLNFTLVPIVLGAILFGPVMGALLGFACGIVVLIQVIMGLAPFYTVIWTNSPFVTVLTCVVKTTAAGLIAGFVYRLLEKYNVYVATFVAAGLVPIINTGLFILGCLCMQGAISAFRADLAMDSMNVFLFIVVVLVTWNFFIEFAINLILAPAIARVVAVVEKKIGAKRKSKKQKIDTGTPANTPQAAETGGDGEQS